MLKSPVLSERPAHDLVIKCLNIEGQRYKELSNDLAICYIDARRLVWTIAIVQNAFAILKRIATELIIRALGF